MDLIIDPETLKVVRDPDNSLARLKAPLKFQSGNALKKGLIIEVSPVAKNGWRCGYDRDKGTVFAVEETEIEVVEGPITPRLFYDTGV